MEKYILLLVFLAIFDIMAPIFIFNFQRSLMKKKDESLPHMDDGYGAILFFILIFFIVHIYFIRILSKINFRENLFKQKLSHIFLYLFGSILYFVNIYYFFIVYFNDIKRIVLNWFSDIYAIFTFITF